ncbi:hypothetical protein [Pseudoalteromonas sp. G4]|uniref:hypothetical protein n=1 Tax=Pseudoalteromonas sp. G4 TaxID=2992761 RepID=UPI00237E4C22|nr:hypothetical protein [Pseudoalteromonas sp. G4]MDE3273485.1 hypothetical protein [Pseudoalteromonas sp. G4]
MGNLNKQNGIVLVAAMLMILMVSGIAVTVMSGSGLDNKMVNATQESYRTESSARGDTEKVIKGELDKKADNQFLVKRSAYPETQEIILSTGDTKVVMTNENKSPVADLLECPPRYAPTPNIKCNYLKLRTVRDYGKGDKHTMTLNTGIEQEMIGGL